VIPPALFSTAFYLDARSNRQGEFCQWILALTMTVSRSASKGCAAQPLREVKTTSVTAGHVCKSNPWKRIVEGGLNYGKG
jgi:hypothetical protein